MAHVGAEPVAQLRKQGVKSSAPPGFRVRICTSCECPILVYGRLKPCLHVFCQQCAASMSACLVCEAAIADIELVHHGKEPLFISGATLQSYRSTSPWGLQHYAPSV
jgi:hypothetical protein